MVPAIAPYLGGRPYHARQSDRQFACGDQWRGAADSGAHLSPREGGMTADLTPLDAAVLPGGVRAGFVPGVNGLTVHMLEAGEPGRPCLLLLHGFPELAYCWRRVMPDLAAAGYYVAAPDLRGYRRTTGWNAD